VADAPHFGFGAGEEPWLPQPADWGRSAVDTELADPGSPLHEYRRTIALRRELELPAGTLTWVDAHQDLVVARNGDVVVALNTGVTPLRVPVRGRVALLSGTVEAPASVVEAAARGEFDLEPNRAAWIVVDEGGAAERS